MIALRHDFDRLLFAKSGIPLVRDLPMTLSIHGGVFWTDFKNHPPAPGDSLRHTGSVPYSEIGFGLGNLTPFLSPFNIAAYFTWNLSPYHTGEFQTNRFAFGFGFTRL